MLLVHARRAPSKIHNDGLIAQEFIPSGTLIWQFQPGFDAELNEAQFFALPAHTRNFVRDYGYFYPQRAVWVLSADDDRFTNHSDTPNVRDDDTRVYALRDIHAGEEIVASYKELGETSFLGYANSRQG